MGENYIKLTNNYKSKNELQSLITAIQLIAITCLWYIILYLINKISNKNSFLILYNYSMRIKWLINFFFILVCFSEIVKVLKIETENVILIFMIDIFFGEYLVLNYILLIIFAFLNVQKTQPNLPTDIYDLNIMLQGTIVSILTSINTIESYKKYKAIKEWEEYRIILCKDFNSFLINFINNISDLYYFLETFKNDQIKQGLDKEFFNEFSNQMHSFEKINKNISEQKTQYYIDFNNKQKNNYTLLQNEYSNVNVILNNLSKEVSEYSEANFENVQINYEKIISNKNAINSMFNILQNIKESQKERIFLYSILSEINKIESNYYFFKNTKKLVVKNYIYSISNLITSIINFEIH